MPFSLERRGDVPGIYGKQGRMLGGPLRSETIERTLCVVFLISDHPADANDEVVETL